MKLIQYSAMACLLAGLGTSTTALADTCSYGITADTYIDLRYPTYNFGNYGYDKVVTSSQPCHTLFQLPTQLWSYSPSQIQSVTVSFYAMNDSTGSYDMSFSPLTHSFLEGTGLSKSNPGFDGASWNTYDGVHSWTTAGGDYDSSVSLLAQKPVGGSSCFTWDITSLLLNPTTASELENNGALLMMAGTAPTDGSQAFATLYSSEGGYLAPVLTVTTVPEPSSMVLLGFAGLGLILRKRASLSRL